MLCFRLVLAATELLNKSVVKHSTLLSEGKIERCLSFVVFNFNQLAVSYVRFQKSLKNANVLIAAKLKRLNQVVKGIPSLIVSALKEEIFDLMVIGVVKEEVDKLIVILHDSVHYHIRSFRVWNLQFSATVHKTVEIPSHGLNLK